MTEPRGSSDPNETPEDVATLYAWANLQGAKYHDFSASRTATREKARQRVEEVVPDQRERGREGSDPQRSADVQRAAEAARAAEAGRAAEAMRQAELAAHPPAQSGSWPRISQERQPAFAAPAAPQAAPQSAASATPPSEFRSHSPFSTQRTTGSPNPARNAPRDEASGPPRGPAAGFESREEPGRPAWLTQSRQEQAAQAPAQAPPETLQGSRDRLTSRWFALKGVFDAPAAFHPEAPEQPAAGRVPVLAVFSLAGGVGKTSLVATLGRTLSARGERLLLVDTAWFGLLPFFFGARDQRPGVLRTFTPPGGGSDAPIQTLAIDVEELAPEAARSDALAEEIFRQARGVSRVFVDVATASGAVARRVLRLSPVVLVPVVPDMTSVVSVGAIDAFFRQHAGGGGKPLQPFYLLNQFDQSLPLHLDVREVLREQLGERLLPFAIRRSTAVSEALAEGMTVMDYAPNSPLAEDFLSLAGWVKNIAAPVNSSYRGARWSER
jgi:cellulose synthase operon protein YhjQ